MNQRPVSACKSLNRGAWRAQSQHHRGVASLQRQAPTGAKHSLCGSDVVGLHAGVPMGGHSSAARDCARLHVASPRHRRQIGSGAATLPSLNSTRCVHAQLTAGAAAIGTGRGGCTRECAFDHHGRSKVASTMNSEFVAIRFGGSNAGRNSYVSDWAQLRQAAPACGSAQTRVNTHHVAASRGT